MFRKFKKGLAFSLMLTILWLVVLASGVGLCFLFYFFQYGLHLTKINAYWRLGSVCRGKSSRVLVFFFFPLQC